MEKINSKSVENEKLLSIEGLRFISSLAIVFDHFLFYPLRHQPLEGALGIFVDLFFVISGVVIASAYSSRLSSPAEYALFIQRRLARLYPLHLATIFIYILIAGAAEAGYFRVDNAQRYDWSQLIPYLTLTQAWGLHGAIAWNGVTWSISAEMFAYLLAPLLLILLRRRPWVGLLFVAVLTALCAFGADKMMGLPFTRLVSKLAEFRALPSFTFGLWLATHKKWLLSSIPSGTAVAVFFLSLGGLVLCLALNFHTYVMLGFVWVLVGTAYRCDLGGISTPASWKPISDQGKLTYSIYLIHPVIATLWLAAIGKRLLAHVPAGPWLSVAIGVVVVLGLSRLSYKYFEEPFRKKLGRPLYRVRDPRPSAMT